MTMGLLDFLGQMAKAIEQAQAQNGGPPPGVSPQQWWQYQSQMRQFDELSRQRMELKQGELMSMAAQAGIDWKP
jgi:hypothetical protein